MVSEDFVQLINFTELEVAQTGADFKEVKFSLMSKLQDTRTILGRKIHLLKNGLTTGEHKSPWHPAGRAVDFVVDGCGKFITPAEIIKALITAGFKGIGVYRWENSSWSFHADEREKAGFWFRWQRNGELRDMSIFNKELH